MRGTATERRAQIRTAAASAFAARGLHGISVDAIARGIGLLNRQFGDLAEFIVKAGEVDGVGPARGTTTLRSYFEALAGEGRGT